MKIETPENFDDDMTQVAPKGKFKSEKTKTLKEDNKKKEILKKIVVARIKEMPDNLRLAKG